MKAVTSKMGNHLSASARLYGKDCVFALGGTRLAAYRAIIGVGLELFGAPVIGLALVFAAKPSDLSEQVMDECVGENSLRVEFLADLIEAIIHWVESLCLFAAQG
jgi:hypothetical protein